MNTTAAKTDINPIPTALTVPDKLARAVVKSNVVAGALVVLAADVVGALVVLAADVV